MKNMLPVLLAIVLAIVLVAVTAYYALLRPSRVQAGCFMIPANPSKAQVLYFINLTKNESECALAALEGYQSSNILMQYNISINLTAIARNITSGSNSSVNVYH
jgi:membrane glycosyltransferase